MTTLADLSEHPPDELIPPLDRRGHPIDSGHPVFADCQPQRRWRADGVVCLPGLIPDSMIDAYCDAFQGGWGIGTPYLTEPTIRDICLYQPLMATLEHLLSEPMGLHLNLTWWRSTTRDWHQDDYLNPPFVNSWYAAAWFALADIHPDSGPFQYVPGSNRWPVVRRDAVLSAMGEDGTDPDWPWRSERLLTPLFEAEIERRHAKVVTYLPKRGDVLLWHGRTVHRGSRPVVPGMERRSLIAHYSATSKRLDMPHWTLHDPVDRLSRYFVL